MNPLANSIVRDHQWTREEVRALLTIPQIERWLDKFDPRAVVGYCQMPMACVGYTYLTDCGVPAVEVDHYRVWFGYGESRQSVTTPDAFFNLIVRLDKANRGAEITAGEVRAEIRELGFAELDMAVAA